MATSGSEAPANEAEELMAEGAKKLPSWRLISVARKKGERMSTVEAAIGDDRTV